MEENQMSLICGLPDDIALSCLARVPRKYHAVLKCVSKRWRELVCSDEFYDYRRMHSLSETWIYALCCDKYGKIWFYVVDPNESQRRWKCVPGLPARALNKMGMGFEVLGKKVYLLGGGGWLESTNEAFCYDVSRNSWTQVASLSTARYDSACQVYDGKIYAIGGLASTRSDPYSWDIFDPHTNSWEFHSNDCAVPEVEDSVVLDGKIYIHCRASASTMSSSFYAVVYEPSSGMWQRADADMVSGWQGPAVVVDGTLYVLDQSSGTKLMMWQKDKREWVAVKRLSTLLTKPPCQLAAIGKKLFIVGSGLSTVVLDTSQTGSVEGARQIQNSSPPLSFSSKMADNPTSPAAGSHESGGEQSPRSGVREQDRYLPIANISRIMKKALPANGKIAKDAKDTVQECVSEFISFVTSEASDKCQKEKRKTINGDDLLWAMATLGFEDYIEPLKVYLARYRELEGDAKGSVRGGDGSSKRDAVGGLPGQNAQFAFQGSMNYTSPQAQGQHMILPSMPGNE